MKKLYLSLMQRFAGRTLARQPEMDFLMLDHSQNAEYSRDGESGALAVLYELIVNAILRLAPQRGQALDICCGSASLLCRVASALPAMQFLGVDLSPNMLQFAERHRSQYRLSNLRFQQGDMYRLADSVTPGFDLITWHLAMHHCADPASVVSVLDQIAVLLKPGGTLFVFDINRPKTGKLAVLMADMFNRRQGDWYYQDSLDSYKAAFSYEELAQIIARSKLRDVVHVQPVVSNLFQAFYISKTDNRQVPRINNLQHLWQKIDYALLRLSFPALPLANVQPAAANARPTQPRQASASLVEPDVLEILDIGTRAMSAYNLQPWRFKVRGDVIFIHFVRRKNFFLKLEGIYYMMVGHLLANLVAGAAAKGYRADFEILSEALSLDVPCVRLKLVKTGLPPVDVAHVVARSSNRHDYSKRRLDEVAKRHVMALCDDANVTVRFSEDHEKERLAKELGALEAVRLGNTKLLREAIDFIRTDPADVALHRDCLDAATLELNPREVALLTRVKARPRLVVLLKWMSVLKNRLVARRAIGESGAMLSFSLHKRDYREFVKLGMMVQDVANELCRHGVASMPVMSGLYLADVLNENPEILSNAGKNAIINACRVLQEVLGKPGQRVSYILRVGYATQAVPPTVRKDIRDLIYGPDERIEG